MSSRQISVATRTPRVRAVITQSPPDRFLVEIVLDFETVATAFGGCSRDAFEIENGRSLWMVGDGITFCVDLANDEAERIDAWLKRIDELEAMQ